ncbi:MAG: YitT family protein, partial [Clostridiales bacterium]|nr:YitT family protein [Clostridiales bacterium]
PNEIAPGGFTGIGQLVNSLAGWPVGTVALLLNVPLFLLSARSLGVRHGLRSVIATVGLSLLIDFLPLPPIIPGDNTERMMLAAIFGGVLGGVGFGLILRGGATTGGSDMLANLVRNRFSFVTIGSVMFAIDGLVIAASAFVFDVVSAMFALISAYLMGTVIDTVVDGLNASHAYLIISDNSDEIARAVMEQLERGVTGLSGRGVYSGSAREVLLVVVSRVEAMQLRAIAAAADPRAFVIAVKAHEVLGEGFKPHPRVAKRRAG